MRRRCSASSARDTPRVTTATPATTASVRYGAVRNAAATSTSDPMRTSVRRARYARLSRGGNGCTGASCGNGRIAVPGGCAHVSSRRWAADGGIGDGTGDGDGTGETLGHAGAAAEGAPAGSSRVRGGDAIGGGGVLT